MHYFKKNLVSENFPVIISICFVSSGILITDPLTPKSEWFLISRYNITLESNVKVTVMTDMVTDLGSPYLQNVKRGNVKKTVWRMNASFRVRKVKVKDNFLPRLSF